MTIFYGVQFALLAAAAFVVGRNPIRRVAAALLVVGAFVLTWFAPGDQISRAVLAGLAVGTLILTVELAVNSKPKFLSQARLRFYPKQVVGAVSSPRIIGCILVELLAVGTAVFTLLKTQHPGSTPVAMLRLAAGVALIYAGVALVFELIHISLVAVGSSVPMIHRTPLAARSVGEFWGQRWNLLVSAWLRRFFFLPLAHRRRPGLGILLAFLVSGAIHGWITLVAVDLSAGIMTVAFFVLQGFFVLVENRLHIHTWPPAAARIWTLTVLLVTSPLFVDPGLRVFGF